jgi:hypothetical protein
VNEIAAALLKNRALNGWSLFPLITVPICASVLTAMARADLSSAAEISSMIQLSVRCSVPWLYLAFAATSIQALFPGAVDHVYYWTGFASWGTRITAWSKRRWQPAMT